MKVWTAVLGILGGISGIVSGFLVTAGGAMFGDDAMANDGSAVFWLSGLAIILAFTAWNKKLNKISAIGILAIAVYGFFANGLFFTIAFIFLLIAGILAFKINKKTNKTQGEF